MKFSVMNENEIEEVIALCNECFFEETDIEYAKKIYEETKDNENDIYIVGYMDGKIVAHGKITIIKTIYKPMATYAILNHICVKPEYRRHNIATHMLEYMQEICIQNDCVKMELWSNNVRVPAHACYKKFGFGLDDAGFFSKVIK